jgi:hypothetical protein
MRVGKEVEETEQLIVLPKLEECKYIKLEKVI